MAGLRDVFVGVMLFLGLTSMAHANPSPGVTLLFEKVENGFVHFGVRIYVGKGRGTFWRANVDTEWDADKNDWVKPELRTLLDWSGSTGIDTEKIIVDWPYVQGVKGERFVRSGYNEEVVLIGRARLTGATATLSVNVTYSDCRKLTDCHRHTQRASLAIPDAPKTDLTKWHLEIPKKVDPCGMRAIYEEHPSYDAPNRWYGDVIMTGSENCMADFILALFEDGRAVADFEKDRVGHNMSFNPDPDGGRMLDLIGQHITIVFGASTRVKGKNYNKVDIYEYRFRIEPGRLKPGTRL